MKQPRDGTEYDGHFSQLVDVDTRCSSTSCARDLPRCLGVPGLGTWVLLHRRVSPRAEEPVLSYWVEMVHGCGNDGPRRCLVDFLASEHPQPSLLKHVAQVAELGTAPILEFVRPCQPVRAKARATSLGQEGFRAGSWRLCEESGRKLRVDSL